MGRTDLTLTKVKMKDGSFDYVNLELVQFVDKVNSHFEVYFGSSVVLEIAGDDPTFSTAVTTADTAYGA